MKTFLFPIFIALLLVGCVGGGPVVTKTSTTEVVRTGHSNIKYCIANEIGRLLMCYKGQEPFTTTEQFISVWGKPKSHEVKDGQDYLTYNTDLAWRGLVIFVIIPIPLLLPVGHNEMHLVFEHNQLVRVEKEFGQGNYAICGLHSEGPDPIGCLIWH